MGRHRRAAFAAAVAAVLSLGVSTLGGGTLGGGTAHAAPVSSGVVRLLKSMTLEEKVGQLFVLQVYGLSADTTDPAAVARNRKLYGVDNAAQLIAKYHPGGIIYYSADPDNVDDPRQLAAFSNGIQRAAMAQRVPIPAAISIDQEGGIIARVQPPATQSPGSMAIAAGRRTADAAAMARITGRELRALGVNQDYAPDADVNINPANPVIGVRSFGSDPGLVSRMVAAQVKGYQAGGVIATAKHFPGHGDTDLDSHTSVPVINHSAAEWEQIDLPPFRAAIAAGADSIMTAHIIVPALDPSGDPATLSRPIVTGVLRKRLHYDGVVVTDALEMKGVRDKYGDDRVPVLALKAGVDQLLKPPADAAGNGLFPVQLAAVLEAVRNGELSERRIDQSVYRILSLKMKRGLFRDPYADESRIDQTVGTPAHLATAQRTADRTTTLIKNATSLLPLPAIPPSGNLPPPADPLATEPADTGPAATAPTVARPAATGRTVTGPAYGGRTDAATAATGSAVAGRTATGAAVTRPMGAESAGGGARKVLVAGWGVTTTGTVAAEIARRGASSSAVQTGLSPVQAQIDQAVAAAGAADLVVAVTNRAWDVSGEPGHNGPGQMNLVKALIATGKPVIVLAVRDPYDIAYFPEATTYLATFSYTTEALRSAVRVLYGELSPQGRLPVPIPVRDHPDQILYPYGHGLRYPGH